MLCSLVALPADAQPGRQGWRVGADTQVSVRGRQDGLPSTGLTIDSLIAAQWGDRTQLIARPVSQGRFDGSWSHDLYQAGIRYQPPTRLPLRLEAGYALPVIGLGLQRSRPIARDMGSFHAHYVTPLPSFETGLPAVYPVTPSYPLVAIASLGMTHWDLRMGVADGSPTRLRGVLRNTGAPRAPQLVVGGGVTPMTGLRIGATFVRGDYTDAEESVASTGSDPMPASYHHDPYSDHDDPYSGATFGSTARHLPGEMDHVSPPEETVGSAGANRWATVSGVEVEYEFTSSATPPSWPSGFETCSRRPRGMLSPRAGSSASHTHYRRAGASPAGTIRPHRRRRHGCSPRISTP